MTLTLAHPTPTDLNAALADVREAAARLDTAVANLERELDRQRDLLTQSVSPIQETYARAARLLASRRVR